MFGRALSDRYPPRTTKNGENDYELRNSTDQKPLHADRNVFDNIALPLAISGYGQAEIARRVRAALDKVGLLNREKANPIVLSGGEQQRVGIARALVHKPELLLADEPTGNLDPTLSWEIMQLFKQFNSVGVTVLIATHDIALINQMNKRQIQLADGRLVADIPGAPG